MFKSLGKRSDSGRKFKSVGRLKDLLGDGKLELDYSMLGRFTSRMARKVDLCFDRFVWEHLSTGAHLIVGFGDFENRGQRALDIIGSHVVAGPRYVPQGCRSRSVGDYHPLQGFAYSGLAGIAPEMAVLGDWIPISTLAVNSSLRIEEFDPRDLGHLLIAAAYYIPEARHSYELGGQRHDLKELFEIAMRTHEDEDLKDITCSGTHMIEGLALVSEIVDGIDGYEERISKQMDRHLGRLLVLGAIIKNMMNGHRNGTEVKDMKRDLEICDGCNGVCTPILLEPGSHLIEAGAVLEMLGYEMSLEERNALRFVANFLLERVIDKYTVWGVYTDIAPLAHLRRGATLLKLLDWAEREGRNVGMDELRDYRVDFQSEIGNDY